ncbi:MAG: hypothetical protein ABGY96_12455 [bacterium]|nr:hypothetical protein [Gammaproteobacteria bacterium]HIL96774.1 hypothetical protein [Pseudomonadales bacterium]
MTRVLTLIVLTVTIGIAGITYGALESAGVIEVETWSSIESNTRLTHTWFVQSSDSILLEAGHPENPWVKDLFTNETIKIRGYGLDGEFRFKVIDDQAAHHGIRNRMREKYGWRGIWISCIFNVEDSLMVEVFPL